jgi:hypothetical protein
MKPSRAFSIGFSVLLWTCPAAAIEPFTSDGCSVFPDRALLSKQDWCTCCLAHDLAYWRGGTAQERLKADRDLRSCVLAATRDAALAELMFAGVRSGGYGWKFGRLYEPLSADEESQAAASRSAYLAKNPSLACTVP